VGRLGISPEDGFENTVGRAFDEGLSDEVCVVVVIDQRLAARPVRTGAPEGRASWPAWRAARKETHHHEFHAV